MTSANHPDDTTHSYPRLLSPGDFELPAVLAMFRSARDSAFGADVGVLMDKATAELEATHPLTAVPAVGDPAPGFELPDHKGGVVSLDSLVATGPAVVVFYRGVWCPYCNLTLRAYQNHVDALRESGASLVAISPQIPDESLNTLERNSLQYDVLSDVGADTARAYGLTFRLPDYLVDLYRAHGIPLPAFNGTDTWELPIPATFIIDSTKTVRFAEAAPDYTQRADPAEIVAAVQKLG